MSQSLNTDRAHLVPGAILTARNLSSNPSGNVCKRCYYHEPHFSRRGSRGTERVSKPGKDRTAKDPNPRHLAPEPTVPAARCAVPLASASSCRLSPHVCHPTPQTENTELRQRRNEPTAERGQLEWTPRLSRGSVCPPRARGCFPGSAASSGNHNRCTGLVRRT